MLESCAVASLHLQQHQRDGGGVAEGFAQGLHVLMGLSQIKHSTVSWHWVMLPCCPRNYLSSLWPARQVGASLAPKGCLRSAGAAIKPGTAEDAQVGTGSAGPCLESFGSWMCLGLARGAGCAPEQAGGSQTLGRARDSPSHVLCFLCALLL